MYIVSREGGYVTNISASKARMSLCRLIDRVAETHEIIRISRKTTNAILVSEEKWNAIQETLYLYGNPETKMAFVVFPDIRIISCVSAT